VGLRTRNSYDIWPVLCLNIEVDERFCCMYSLVLMKSWLKSVWRAVKKRGGVPRGTVYGTRSCSRAGFSFISGGSLKRRCSEGGVLMI